MVLSRDLAVVLLSVVLCACASKVGRGGGGASTSSTGKGSSGLSATGEEGVLQVPFRAGIVTGRRQWI
jgi:hypothetical protein